MDKDQHMHAKWMKPVLLAAAIYNLIWGGFVVLFPSLIFRWLGMQQPNYPELWQCVGMVVGVYGVGYAIAAFNPMQHWPIVLVGFLGKLFGPIGLLQAATQGRLPWRFGLLNVTNDLIWLGPFGVILLRAYQANVQRAAIFSEVDSDNSVSSIVHRDQ